MTSIHYLGCSTYTVAKGVFGQLRVTMLAARWYCTLPDSAVGKMQAT